MCAFNPSGSVLCRTVSIDDEVQYSAVVRQEEQWEVNLSISSDIMPVTHTKIGARMIYKSYLITK